MKENNNGTDTNVGSMKNSIEEITFVENEIKNTRRLFEEVGSYTFFDEDLCKAIEHILSDYKRVLKENEEKNKIIDSMIKVMIDSSICDYFIKEKCKNYAGENGKICDDCIKQYFENKVKEVR